ncbi:DUF1796 family putative cysteine peptidase [Priestia aryabhattai]|uniref:DUF1796 family putative cysteine peptidase n=2 Tax=Priestia aryabhattai TaxID=412384 RepID=A0AAX6NIK1_PRIAR|nr:DUF1796 family putative cysteine peptidase [Priestia aryabhattai]
MIILNLQDIKGSYDLMLGLGSWCGPSLNLRRHNWRRFSFPLDWMISNSIADVSRLLKNKFSGFMDLENLQRTDGYAHFLDDGVAIFPEEGGTEPVNAHFIHDMHYNIISVHDFPIIPNVDWTVMYPSYKEKLNQRITRFFEKIENSPSVLFIRWGAATPEEAIELKTTLSELVKGPFNILLLQPLDGLKGVIDMNWTIDGICSVQVPLDNPNDEAIWDYVLNGLSLTNFWA